MLVNREALLEHVSKEAERGGGISGGRLVHVKEQQCTGSEVGGCCWLGCW